MDQTELDLAQHRRRLSSMQILAQSPQFADFITEVGILLDHERARLERGEDDHRVMDRRVGSIRAYQLVLNLVESRAQDSINELQSRGAWNE